MFMTFLSSVILIDIIIQISLILFMSTVLKGKLELEWLISFYMLITTFMHVYFGNMILQKAYYKPIMSLLDFIKENSKQGDSGVIDNYEPYCQLKGLEEIKKHYDEVLEQRCNNCVSLNESISELSFNEKRYQAIVEILSDILFTYDNYGNFVDVKTSDEEKLFNDKASIIGKNLKDIMPDHIAEKGMICIEETLRTGHVSVFRYELEIKNRLKHFETRMIKFSKNRVLAIVRDVTESELEKRRIEFLSYQDPLTSMFNRRYYQEKMDELKNKSIRNYGLLIVDVNGLKLVNDTFGHAEGDEWIIKVSRIIEDFIDEEQDYRAMRIGGDEFVILCPNTVKTELAELSDQIVKQVAKAKINGINLSISTGYEVHTKGPLEPENLFARAENHLLRKKLTESQSMRHNAVDAIISTLNEKSERERWHSTNVSNIAKKLAQSLNMRTEEINDIVTASLLHDIGKITIDDEILNKPGKLTFKEYRLMQKHVESSYKILKTIDAYSHLAEYVYSHHERWDGSGYPRGLKGENIPLAGRIICVADAYEAMRADRSYRKGMSHEKAISELINCSGTQFDPRIVDTFVVHYTHEWYEDQRLIS